MIFYVSIHEGRSLFILKFLTVYIERFNTLSLNILNTFLFLNSFSFFLNKYSGPLKQTNFLELFLLVLGDYPTCKLCKTLILFYVCFLLKVCSFHCWYISEVRNECITVVHLIYIATAGFCPPIN